MERLDRVSPTLLVHCYALMHALEISAQKLMLADKMNLIELLVMRSIGVCAALSLAMGKAERNQLFKF